MCSNNLILLPSLPPPFSSRLQKLEDLAQSILTSCATTSVTLDTLESEVEEFETSCTSLPPQTVQENAVAIRDKLQVRPHPLATPTLTALRGLGGI